MIGFPGGSLLHVKAVEVYSECSQVYNGRDILSGLARALNGRKYILRSEGAKLIQGTRKSV